MATEDDDSGRGGTGGIEGAINAAANLARAVPVYDDALQPFAKQAGRSLETVGRTVNAVLMPVRGLVWGAEKVEEWISSRVAEKLEDTAVENIVSPDLQIAGRTVESLKFAGHKPELSELFANLLASSMDLSRRSRAHPSFVDFINSMSEVDAKLFSVLCSQKTLPISSIDLINSEINGRKSVIQYYLPAAFAALKIENMEDIRTISASFVSLNRMGLIEIERNMHYPSFDYEAYKSHYWYKQVEAAVGAEPNRSVGLSNGLIEITPLGESFKAVCLP